MNKIGKVAHLGPLYWVDLQVLYLLITGNIFCIFSFYSSKSALLARQRRVKPSEFKSLNYADINDIALLYYLDLLSYVMNCLICQMGLKCFKKLINKQVKLISCFLILCTIKQLLCWVELKQANQTKMIILFCACNLGPVTILGHWHLLQLYYNCTIS